VGRGPDGREPLAIVAGVRASRSLTAAAALAAVAALAGCGGGSSGGDTAANQPQPTSSASTVPTASASASASASATATASPSATAATAVTRCTSSELTVSLGESGAGAGNFYIPVVFTNRSSSTCVLGGFPGVSFTTKGGTQLGPAAKRSGGHGKLVRLAPGHTASSLLHEVSAQAYDPGSCHLVTAREVKVYPPGETVALTVAAETQLCRSGEGRASVAAVQAGSNPQQ
jgi:hypothetical protein